MLLRQLAALMPGSRKSGGGRRGLAMTGKSSDIGTDVLV